MKNLFFFVCPLKPMLLYQFLQLFFLFLAKLFLYHMDFMLLTNLFCILNLLQTLIHRPKISCISYQAFPSHFFLFVLAHSNFNFSLSYLIYQCMKHHHLILLTRRLFFLSMIQIPVLKFFLLL